MRTFARKQNQAQKTVSSSLARSHTAKRGAHRLILHLERKAEGQAVQRMLQPHAEEVNAGLTGTASTRFGHDFSGIPTHPRAAGALRMQLTVNKPEDVYEQEANRISEQVMRMPEPRLQRACACGGGCPKCQAEQSSQEHARLQTKRGQPGSLGQTAVQPIVHEGLASPSQPLGPAIRRFMDLRFGHDFSRVRVHDGSKANASARALGANAYTVGKDVVFGRRMSGFQTRSERELLAHELVHVAQSGGAAAGSASFPTRVSAPTGPAEHEADHLSRGSAFQAIQPSPPRTRVSPGTLLPQLQPQPLQSPRIQATQADFHDPNFCYRPGSPRDSTHPDRSRVVAVMQAQIATPTTCDGAVVLRTSVLRSSWGAVSAQFESFGGGVSQGIYESIQRDDAAERVDYEEHFRLDDCQAYFDRCHLITFYEGGTRYTFAEAGYRPRIFATSEPSGTVLHDDTPAPRLIVDPCDNVTPTQCGGQGGTTGASTRGAAGAPAQASSPSTSITESKR